MTVEVVQVGQGSTVTTVEVGSVVIGGAVELPGTPVLVGYLHVQSVAQSVWPVPHRLGRYPSAWSLFDDADGRLCSGYEVQHLDVDNLRVVMDTPTAGTFRTI